MDGQNMPFSLSRELCRSSTLFEAGKARQAKLATKIVIVHINLSKLACLAKRASKRVGAANNLKLTKRDATKIIASCGLDIRYSFVKPLVDIGGVFPNYIIDGAKEYIKEFELALSRIPEGEMFRDLTIDMISGFNLVLQFSKS